MIALRVRVQGAQHDGPHTAAARSPLDPPLEVHDAAQYEGVAGGRLREREGVARLLRLPAPAAQVLPRRYAVALRVEPLPRLRLVELRMEAHPHPRVGAVTRHACAYAHLVRVRAR